MSLYTNICSSGSRGARETSARVRGRCCDSSRFRNGRAEAFLFASARQQRETERGSMCASDHPLDML